MKKFLTTATILFATSNAALAHPGEHGFSFFNSLLHLATEPDHLAIFAVAAAAAVFAYKRFRRPV